MIKKTPKITKRGPGRPKSKVPKTPKKKIEMVDRFITGEKPKLTVMKKAAKRINRLTGKPISEFGGKRPKINAPDKDDKRRCTALNKQGVRCSKWASVGDTVCAKHGGNDKVFTSKPSRTAGLYDPNYHPRYTIQLMKEGFALAEVCSKFGINPATFERWCKTYQTMMDAWNTGLVHAEAYWVSKVRNNLENRSFNDRLFSMYMVNRFNWNSGKTSQTVDIQAKVSGVLVAPAAVPSVSDWAQAVKDEGQVPAEEIEYNEDIDPDDNDIVDI